VDYSDWSREALIARLAEIEGRLGVSGKPMPNAPDRERSADGGGVPLVDVTDSLPVLISYIDADRRFRSCNRTYEEWWGISQDEIIGRPVREILGEATYDIFKGYMDRVLSGETVIAQATVNTARKGRRHTHTIYVPDIDTNNEVRGFFVSVTDITELKDAEISLREAQGRLESRVAERTLDLEQANASLRESEARYRAILDNMQDTYYRTDEDGRLTMVSRSAADLLGYP